MPDARLADGLITTARRLLPATRRKPTQADLRRAISAAYYAAFHALAKSAADSLVGATKSRRPNKAWVEVYRGLDHGTCKEACERANKINFPDELQNFAENFAQLQVARHAADYDPMVRFTKKEAELYISLAEKSIETLKQCSSVDRKAFATWVLITSRGAREARKRAQKGLVRAL